MFFSNNIRFIISSFCTPIQLNISCLCFGTPLIAVAQSLYPELIRLGDAIQFRNLLLEAGARVLSHDMPVLPWLTGLAMSALVSILNGVACEPGLAGASHTDASRVIYRMCDIAKVRGRLFETSGTEAASVFNQNGVCSKDWCCRKHGTHAMGSRQGDLTAGTRAQRHHSFWRMFLSQYPQTSCFRLVFEIY